MTVKQLMNKLKKVPEDYVVTVGNDYCYFDGIYKADDIDIDKNRKQVEISTDYKYRWNYYGEKWEK
jgi:hypothetical protein